MKYQILAVLLGLVSLGATAQDKTVDIYAASKAGDGELLGKITLTETDYGVLLTPDLKGLPPGLHGFHIHEHPHCGALQNGETITPAGAAGGHFDPQKTGQHLGPYHKDGHLGDLPALYVDHNGQASLAVLAPKISTISTIQSRAIMIHQGGDNHSDKPQPLGGGGARIACGVIH